MRKHANFAIFRPFQNFEQFRYAATVCADRDCLQYRCDSQTNSGQIQAADAEINSYEATHDQRAEGGLGQVPQVVRQ